MTRVHILATGGTIAGTGPSRVDPAYRAGGLSVDVLVDAVPGLRELATLTGEQFSQVGSQDMNDGLWLKLAARINTLFSANEADGIVVTHGTDTGGDGVFPPSRRPSERPVVLTGSMRPATALSADGPLNLFNAVSVAADPDARGRGTIVAINDDLHSARDVTKSSTTDVQTFVSPGPGLLGTASYGRIRYFRHPTHVHTRRPNSLWTAGTPCPASTSSMRTRTCPRTSPCQRLSRCEGDRHCRHGKWQYSRRRGSGIGGCRRLRGERRAEARGSAAEMSDATSRSTMRDWAWLPATSSIRRKVECSCSCAWHTVFRVVPSRTRSTATSPAADGAANRRSPSRGASG